MKSQTSGCRALLLLVGLALVASACSAIGLDGGAAEDGAASTEETEPSSTGGGAALAIDEDEETIADLETAWAAQRARVVDALTSSTYGLGADGILRGPARLEVDLDDCPADWDDTEGVSGTTITVGLIVAQTGQLGSFRLLADGMRAYFDWVNENGGIDGRQLELVLRDDTYDPGVAQAAVDDLLDNVSPFMVASVGSPSSLAVYDDLNAACVPHPYVVSAHPAWGDPEEHPFTTGFELSYSTEAIVWGTWIKANLGADVPVEVVGLVTDNEFGRIYADSFGQWAAENPDVVSQLTLVEHDPAAIEVSAEMEEVAELRPEVFISMTNGQPCISAVAEADRLGVTDTALALFTPSVCKQPTAFMVPSGAAGEGFHVVGGGVRSLSDPAVADDTFVRFARRRLTDTGLDPDQSLVGVGFAHYGWAHVETLRVAAALPGGLTRSNLTLAMRNIDLQHPMLFDGVRFSTQGVRDGFVIEGAEVSRYDAAERVWRPTGSALDLNGLSPNCVWDDLACS